MREESDKHKGILKSINDEFKNSLALDDPRSRWGVYDVLKKWFRNGRYLLGI